MKINSKSEFYKKANNVRTKLLLFIDKEVQSFKKRKPLNKKFIEQENPSEQFLIVIEVTFTHKDKIIKEDNYIQFSVRNNKKQITKSTIPNIQDVNNSQCVKQSLYTESTFAETPINTPQQKKIDNFIKRTSYHYRTVQPTMKPEEQILNISDKKRKTFHKKAVCFQNSIFSSKRKNKHSKTVKMCTKPTNGRRFLKELCFVLKKPELGDQINPCKTFFNKLKNQSSKGPKIKKFDYSHCETIEEKKDETNIFLDNIDEVKRRVKFSFRTSKKKKDFNFAEFMNRRKNREDKKFNRENKKKLSNK